jgi:uncharacterized delta-60 repeat protein
MKKILLLFLLSLSFISHAQNSGDVALKFGAHPGFNTNVYSIVTQPDGKILFGGNFTAYNGTTKNYIVRLNTDGSIDNSFNMGTGFNSGVRSIALQSDGKIIVGGYFSSYNGTVKNRIIRLNPDGSSDTAFNIGVGFNNEVEDITIQTDGKIIVGGNFTSFNGVNRNYITRLNTNGSLDGSFYIGVGLNRMPHSIAVQNDGKITVGGEFSSYNGTAKNKIIRLNTDGSLDSSFNIGTGFSDYVYSIAIQPDGKIIVGGSFYSYNGATKNRIIRLNTDGSPDNSFNIGTGFDSYINAIAFQPDGKIIVGGEFYSYNDVNKNNIIRLNPDGSIDTSFNMGVGFDAKVHSIAIQNDGKIFLEGDFSSYNNTAKNYVIRINQDGTPDNSFNTGIGYNKSVFSIVQQNDGKIIVGGFFTTYSGTTQNYITRLNADGSLDSSFNTGIGFDNIVRSIVLQPDGKIIVGGDFGSYNGTSQNYITRLNADGSRDTSFNIGSGFSSYVDTVALQPDGKIIVGGLFNAYNGISRISIIRLNEDGSLDTSFNIGTGFNNAIISLAIQNDGKIIVGGYFSTYNGSIKYKILRLNVDGSIDNSFNTGSGFVGNVNTLTLLPDGKIIVGGNFVDYNGTSRSDIIRLNTDGSLDTDFNIGSGFNNVVYCTKIQNDGKIIVGGFFSSYNGTIQNNIVRLNTDGSVDTSFNTGVGFNNSVFSIALLNDGKIMLGGGFTTYKSNNESAYLIELYSETSLSTADFTSTNDFSIYPNPVSETFTIDLSDVTRLSFVKIYDLQGKLILETKNKIVDVRNLTAGFYIVKVKTAEGEFTKKFIKE